MTDGEKKRISSPVIDVNGTPSFKVQVDGKETVFSAHDVAVRYINSLFTTARDFLSGVPIAGAVLSVPLNFSPKQMTALKKAATEAGLIVLQLISAPAAALTAYGLTSPKGSELPAHPDGEEGQAYLPGTELDRTVIIVDVGGTSTSVALVHARSGLYSLLGVEVNPNIGGVTIDDALITYLAKEFTKKTKVQIDVDNYRAWAKLRNEVEITKRSLSASNSAQCSVESLADGVDFSQSVNRLRLDICARKVWDGVQQLCEKVLKSKGLEAAHVDEVLLVGGTARLQGLKDSLSSFFGEKTHITDSIDADQALARGCAVHAQAIATTASDSLERTHLIQLPLAQPFEIKELKTKATTKAIGILIPQPTNLSNGNAEEIQRQIVNGKLFVTLIPKGTPLPARRLFELGAQGDSLLDLHEGEESVKVDKIERQIEDEDDEDDEDLDEEDKFIEIRTVLTKPIKQIGQVVVTKDAIKANKALVEIRIEVEGKLKVFVGGKSALEV